MFLSRDQIQFVISVNYGMADAKAKFQMQVSMVHKLTSKSVCTATGQGRHVTVVKYKTK